MIQLTPADMLTAKQMLTEGSPTFSHALAEGIIPGKIFADDPAYPRTALFQTSSGIYYLAGTLPDTGGDKWLHYLNEQRNGGRFTVLSASEDWDAFLIGGLKEPLKQMKRTTFSFADERSNPREEIGVKIEMFHEADCKQSVHFSEKYADEYWGGTANFLKNSFGFKVLHEGRTVSECVAIFRSERFAEVDIATHADFRGKGFAVHCARAFISYCKDHKLEPRWDCDLHNKASIRLAEKLGFCPLKTYSLFVEKR
ncbi:GNAT family N-acetyltransferase [Bacillus swezeyi]|uniref:GNAT family N-acetyltransferase n=1 Tax=Bacillus swezeyi TaxID=1925020 RepID=UPI0027DCA4DE|nr:GNAT family N-acetyltransferase [Bacillus swezeyi]